MIVRTVQLAKWRKVKELGIELLDTTVKSGIKTYAPSWDIVRGVKSGEITEAEYTVRYIVLLHESYLARRKEWLDLIKKDSIAIACYCSPGKFCHRHILADVLEKICQRQGIPFENKGEIT